MSFSALAAAELVEKYKSSNKQRDKEFLFNEIKKEASNGRRDLTISYYYSDYIPDLQQFGYKITIFPITTNTMKIEW